MTISKSWLWVALAVVFLSMACGAGSFIPSIPGLPPKPSLSNKPTGSSPLSGDWNADTDFGHFAFTVDPNGAKVITAVIRISNFTCGGTTLTTETQVLNSWPISDSAFSGDVNLESGENFDIYFDGAYNDSTKTFSGTWEEDAYGTTCSGDWETAPHQ